MSLGRPYRTLWTAAAISNLGDGLSLVAFPLLAARLTRDPVAIAGVATAARLPWLLFALHAGALADRLDRRTLMGVVDLARAAVVAVLAIAVLTDAATLWLLYGVVFLLGIAETLFDNAAQALMPSLVEHEQLERANSRLYGVEIVANSFVGPPIGGFLFAAMAAAPFFVDAATFAVAAVLILAIPGRHAAARADEARAPIHRDIAEGLRWLWGNRIVRGMAVSLGVFNLAYNGALAVFVLFALEVLDLDARGYGLLLLGGAAGSVTGSILASRISSALGRGRTLVVVGVVTAIDLALVGTTSSSWIVGALFAIDGVAGITWNVVTVSLRQSLIPDRLLGRVNSVYRLLGWGSIPIGALLGGIAADAFGLRAPFFIAAGILVAMTVFLVRPVARAIEAHGR